MSKKTVEELKAMATRMRLTALDMALGAGRMGAHLGPAMSCIEILATLYGRVLKVDATNPTWVDRDRFFVSKAHCVLALYTALSEAGFITREELATFEKNGTRLAGHPTMNSEFGLEYGGGSLGMALGVAIGVALDARQKKRTHRTVVLLGDGELDEGSNWEGFMAAGHFALANMIVIIDKNKLQNDGLTDDIMGLGDLGAKMNAFGWDVAEVDGHDINQLLEVLEREQKERPLAIIAHTIKGKGVSFMENIREWHHCTLSPAQYEQAVNEIKEVGAL